MLVMNKICYIVTIPITVRAFFIQQLRFLSLNGFDVSVICSDDGLIGDELGGTIKYIPLNMPRGISLLGSIRSIRQLVSIFKREQFDLIQYSTPNAAFYSSIAAKIVGCKRRNYHLMGLRYLGAKGLGRIVLKRLEKISCDFSTSIECVSSSNLEMCISEGLFKSKKACVVWNGSTGGVDLNRFNYESRSLWRSGIRADLGFDETDFVFGFVGRITRDKGINDLLNAFFALSGNSKLLLVGPTDELGTLDKELLYRSKTDSRIVFHAAVNDIERYYAAIDVLVLPSYREGFGNVVIEAGAVGTPAIVSRIPGPVDAIEEGVTAFTVEPANVVDLQMKMEEIMETDYKHTGKKAYEFVKMHFDSDELCKRILERKRFLMVD